MASQTERQPHRVWIAWGTKYEDHADEHHVLGVFDNLDAAEKECEAREDDWDGCNTVDYFLQSESRWDPSTMGPRAGKGR